jgi:cob(I)alamin adenosyltransferase
MGDRINRVTTRSGDEGETGLADGGRLSKAAPRVEALGEVDEANACVGMLRAVLRPGDELDGTLTDLQHRLFDVGGALSLPGTTAFDAAAVTDLEQAAAALNDTLPPLANFVLPSGDDATARAHVARTVCRRAERALVRLAEAEPDRDDPALRHYLNRASDLLFVVARILARRAGEEQLWTPRPRS